MSEVMILENRLDGSWNHCLRLMAGKSEALDAYPLPVHATVKRYQDDIRLQHLDASWPARELARVLVMGDAYRLAVIWWIGSEKVSRAMLEAGGVFALAFGVDPQYAFIRSIPAGAAEFAEVHGICLVQAGWIPDGFLSVTSGGLTRNLQAFKVEKAEVMA